MKNFYGSSLRLLLLLTLLSSAALAQTTVSGTVTDENNEPLPSANIVVRGTQTGTVTDVSGRFSFQVNQTPPFVLVVSFTGYSTTEVRVTEGNTTGITVRLSEGTLLDQVEVLGPERTPRKLIESTAAVEVMSIEGIRQVAASDFYEGLANLKGVTMTTSSFNFPQVNTRGFATIANTRFVQMIDGIDTQAPLLNFPTGNIVGISELDVESVELLPGAASALYGPNAFNGILLMQSISPFNQKHQGLSAQTKLGFTNSDAQGETNPMYNFAVRYARAVSDRFAFKFNFAYMRATDWKGNDYRNDINRINEGIDYSATPDFDGVNLYGDEAELATGVPSIGTIHRTGFREEDILDDYSAKSIKGDVALHYKPTEKLEAIYNFRIGSGDAIYQGSQKYALRDFIQQFHKLELRGDNFFVRGYVTATDAGKSYNVGALGAYMNETYNPTRRADGTGWAQEYVLAMQGYIPGITPGNHDAARGFADRNRPQPGTEAFATLAETVRSNYFQRQPPGAAFIDNSRLYHGEFNYNTKDKFEFAEIQIGGNVRRYSLFSDGTIFNEDPEEGTNFQRINIDEYGLYTQLQKTIADQLKLTGSIRYDKNQNFEGRFTPRVSAVFNDPSKTHYLRASYQTGFRNPDTQAQYIYFPAGLNTLLGSTRENAERYGVHEGGAYSRASYDAFRAAGGRIDPVSGVASGADPSILKTDYVEYIRPERQQTYEFGYRSQLFNANLLVDLSAYFTQYQDFIGGDDVVSKMPTTHQGNTLPAGTIFSPYRNETEKVTSNGVGLGLTYKLGRGFALNGSYNYAEFSVDEEPNSTFRAGFNTPNNKFNVGFGRTTAQSKVGFNINYRWQESFLWQSDFGDWTVPEFGVLDAQVSLRVPSIMSIVKLGGTNLGGGDYRTNFGGPFVGQTYYLSITFDQAFKN